MPEALEYGPGRPALPHGSEPRLERWGVAAVLALAAGLLTWGLTHPFVGHHDWNSAWISAAARNHLEYGLGITRLAVIENNATVPAEWFQVYTSHPPLVPLVVAAFQALLGESEWVTRLVPALFTLASTLLLYLLGRSLAGPRLGLAAALLFILLPGVAYFGRVANHEPIVMAFGLGAVLAYSVWHRSRQGRWLALSVALVLAAALSDWPGYYLAALLPAHHWLAAGRGRRDAWILAFPAIALLAFGLHVAHLAWLQGEAGVADLGAKFLYRTQLGAALGAAAAPFGAGEFLFQKASHAYRIFTPPPLLLALLGFAALLPGRRTFSDPALVMTLLAFGALHVLLFPGGAFYHDYWLLYLAPAVALLAAGEALRLSREGLDRRAVTFIAGVVLLVALPQLHHLHGRGWAGTLEAAEALRTRTTPEERLLSNAGFLLAHAPQVGYYASRDVAYDPVVEIVALHDSLAIGRPFAYLYSPAEDEPGEIGAWLEEHLEAGVLELADGMFRLYRRPDRLSEAAEPP